MTTIIVPGFSVKNHEWAQNLAQNLTEEIKVLNYPHWESGNNTDFSVSKMADELVAMVGQDPVNIVAKSVGNLISATALPRIKDLVNRLVILGIPISDLHPEDPPTYKNLDVLGSEKVSVFQNDQDPHGTFDQAVGMFKNIGLGIEITKMPAADHEYLYPEEVKKVVS
jgi:predicted alpha/beta hydrolase family esterase